MLAERLDLRPSVARCVGNLFERWDGKGIPGELAGEAIPIPARIVAVARDVDIFHRIGGWEQTTATLRRRRTAAYDPAVVDIFLTHGEQWLGEAGEDTAWDSVLAAEPGSPVLVGDLRLDRLLGALADFTDIKSPYTLDHSSGVARLAERAARCAGLGEGEATNVRRAALVHDLGRTSIWDKPGRLSATEWERVRLHPHFTERILARSSALAHLASMAGAHHERLDGSGYHRGSPATLLPLTARLLAAADAYQAMTQDAGLRKRTLRRTWPAGLTEREVEVLRLISRGHPNRVVAQQLGISAKTVSRHVDNLYAKIGVSSRAAAALFAMEHGLLDA
jgi:HD-GYP domain-containing protein (c-di-GMP phosphodiesterase class II)/DNA-binding CsgD family transcriptional regulator